MNVKVILKQDVGGLGRRGDVVQVKAGFARNYLLPRGLALEATPGNLKMLEMQRRAWQRRELRAVEEARGLAGQLEALEVVLYRKAGENETLYGSVTNADIAESLAEQGFRVDRRSIVLDAPIKTLGTHAVPVKLHPQVTVALRVRVLPEAPGS